MKHRNNFVSNSEMIKIGIFNCMLNYKIKCRFF